MSTVVGLLTRNFRSGQLWKRPSGTFSAFYWRIYEPYSGTREHRSRLRYFTSQLIHRYVNGVQIDTKKKTVEINPEYEKEVTILKELTWTYVIEAPGQGLQREGQRKSYGACSKSILMPQVQRKRGDFSSVLSGGTAEYAGPPAQDNGTSWT